MKFDKYLFLVFLSAFLFSCSEDKQDDIQIPTIETYEYDAFLSLAVGDTELNSKAAATSGSINPRDKIERLSLAVFRDDKLVAFKESVAEGDKSVNRIDEVPVVSGSAKILLIANYKIPADWYQKVESKSDSEKGIGVTTLADFQTLTVTLDKEITGKLTMSSKVLTLNLHAGHNFAGCYATVGNVDNDPLNGYELLGTKNKILLYHNVSRVQLESITLAPNEHFGGGKDGSAEFHLLEVFVANVKGISHIDPDDDNHVEYSNPKSGENLFWCADSYAQKEGPLKTGTAQGQPWLIYDFVEHDGKEFDSFYDEYPFLNGFSPLDLSTGTKVDGYSNTNLFFPGKADPSSTQRSTYTGGYFLSVGMFFYIYENNQIDADSENQTLFVIKGEYKYKNKEDKAPTTQDCYYAVLVNKDGTSTDISGTVPADHKYVKRNNWYSLYVTLKGPGATGPFGKDLTANISTTLKVQDWNVIKMKEEVE